MNELDKLLQTGNHLLPDDSRKLPKRPRGLDKTLAKYYRQGDSWQLLAAVMNAAATQKRGAFILTRRRVAEIVKNDKNLTSPINLNDNYRLMLRRMHDVASVETATDIGQLVTFTAQVLALLEIPEDTAKTQYAACLAGIAGKKKEQEQPAPNMSEPLQPEASPGEETDEEIAEKIWVHARTDESEWHDAMSGFDESKYERIRDMLKEKRNVFWRKMA